MIIGITGGTGCGKTTALGIIRDLGGQIIDCDQVYHRLLVSDKALLCAIETRFPGCVVDGVLQRQELAKRVFQDPEELAALNAITHPAVKTAVMGMLPAASLAAIDAIELFDGGLGQLCDVTVAVTAPLEDRVTRLMQRDGLTEELARMRIAAQKPEEYFRKNCDYILENNSSQEDFQKKCLAFFQNLLII